MVSAGKERRQRTKDATGMGHRFFRHMEPALARLHTLLAGRVEGLAFSAGGRKWRLTESPPPGRAYGVVAYGIWGGEEFTLWLNADEWRVAAAAVLDVEPARLEAMPEPVLRAALELFAGDALDALGKATGAPVSLRRLAVENATPVWPAPTFALERDDGLRLGGAWIVPGRDPAWLDGLEKALRKQPARTRTLPDDWEIPAAVRAGKAWRFPAGLLSGLEPGDVALPPAGDPEEWRAFSVHFQPGIAIAAEKMDGRFATRGTLMSVRNNPSAGAFAPAAPVIPESGTDESGMVAVEEVEVDLHIEVARASFTLGQISRLATGQVVEFAAPVEGPARLCAGTRTVAEGELVEVGGRVGFRIARLASAPRERI